MASLICRTNCSRTGSSLFLVIQNRIAPIHKFFSINRNTSVVLAPISCRPPPIKFLSVGYPLDSCPRSSQHPVGRAPSPARRPLPPLPAAGRGRPARSRGTAPPSRWQEGHMSQVDTQLLSITLRPAITSSITMATSGFNLRPVREEDQYGSVARHSAERSRSQPRFSSSCHCAYFLNCSAIFAVSASPG
jgi:hypothetical protein